MIGIFEILNLVGNVKIICNKKLILIKFKVGKFLNLEFIGLFLIFCIRFLKVRCLVSFIMVDCCCGDNFLIWGVDFFSSLSRVF